MITFLLALLSLVHAYDWTYGNLTLYHSESTYCSPSTYLTRTYKGPLQGFVPTYAIEDATHDTHGYIGYHAGQKAIYVAFRGSESITNWLSDLDAVLISYPHCSGCEVHKGFYTAEQAVITSIISEVSRLLHVNPTYQVLVTGHSLGSALSTLTASDLVLSGITNVRLFNYGSPRVGNTAFANYYQTIVKDRNRVTHHKDTVPHVPMHERFTHISGEYYEPDNTVRLNVCTGQEDPNCSYQWSITSISDHLYYLGVQMGEGTAECSQVLV
jgi:hypothetical protein